LASSQLRSHTQDLTSFSASAGHTAFPALPTKALVGCAALAAGNALPQKFEWLAVGGHTLGWLQKVWLKMLSGKCMRISPLRVYTYVLFSSAPATSLSYWRISFFFDAWCLIL